MDPARVRDPAAPLLRSGALGTLLRIALAVLLVGGATAAAQTLVRLLRDALPRTPYLLLYSARPGG